MLIKDKRGFALSEFMTVLLMFVGFMVVFFALFSILYPRLSDMRPVELCHSSVALRTSTSIDVGTTDVHWGPLQCETIEEEIGGSKEEIKGQLAQMMARCWYMFGEGRHDEFLESSSIMQVLGWEDNENECFICYTAMIDEDEIEGSYINPEEMMNYLVEKDHYKIQGMKYIDYIQNYGGPGVAAVMDNIYPQRTYGIVFLAKEKDESGWTIADTFVALGTAAAAVSCVASVGATCVIIAVAGTSYIAAHGANEAEIFEMKKEFYENERPVSMVVLDDLNAIQYSGCDIVGQS